MDFREYIRDIKLGILTGKYNIEIKSSNKRGFFSFLKPGYRLVNDIIDRGAILTGSRALKCYLVNGYPVLDRRPDDWDFVIDESTALKICDDYRVYDYDKKVGQNFIIPINRQMILLRDSTYGDKRIVPVNINLIVVNENPSHKIVDGVKFADFGYIIEEKNKLSNGEYNSKHSDDLKQIIARIHNSEHLGDKR